MIMPHQSQQTDNMHLTSKLHLHRILPSQSLAIVLFPILLVLSILSPQSHALKLPYLATQDAYMVYTDAHFFHTSVFVNGAKLNLSNPGGSGLVSTAGVRFSGEIGYPNQVNINGFLQPGKNRIEVHYRPSFIDDTDDEEEVSVALWSMFNHTVISKGKLNDRSLGLESHELDQAISEAPESVEVLLDHLQRRFDREKTETHRVVEFNLDLPENALARASFNDCELDEDRSLNFNGALFLNDVQIFEFELTRRTSLENWKDFLKQGENTLALRIDKIEDDGDAQLTAQLKCDLGKLKQNTPIAQMGLELGQFFDKASYPILSFNAKKPGNYQANFQFDDMP